MKLRDLFRTAFENLRRHKARMALTTVGVVVGILTIVTMVSLGIGVQYEMRRSFGSVGLESFRLRPVTEESTSFDPFGLPERTKLLTPQLIRDLEAREEVIDIVPHLNLPRGMRMVLRLDGKEVQADAGGRQPARVPDPFEAQIETLAGEEKPPSSGGGIVLSAAALSDLGFEADQFDALLGREVQLILFAPRGGSQSIRLQIAGVVDRRWGNAELALPDRLALLEWWFNDPEYLAHRGYDEVLVRTTSLADAAQTVDLLADMGYAVTSLKTILDLANRGMIIVQTMLGSVGALALLVASIGIANTMIMAVYERTREIGILKAVGAAPGQIRALFVIEASLIGLLGGVVGTILGWLLGKGLNWLILRILEWQEVNVEGTFFVVTWWLVLAALVFAALVGLLAGLYPAARAARLAPLDALRYE
jgi:ABC-type lipoprotein release transport system permease subunit